MDVTASDHVPSGPPPVSVHFVNNVLAAAASYVEDDPDEARDVLALLSQFLTYRLHPGTTTVPVARELEHVATYLRLEQARFPGRLELDLPQAGELADVRVARAAIQSPVADHLGRRLGERPGACRLTLRIRPGRRELDLELATPGEAAEAAEHVRIEVEGRAVETV
jgi:LytS/YehU family sensor histidine kinase